MVRVRPAVVRAGERRFLFFRRKKVPSVYDSWFGWFQTVIADKFLEAVNPSERSDDTSEQMVALCIYIITVTR
jgi:hypothetical protein